MAKSKLDKILDKSFATKEELQFVYDYYSNKPFEELTEEEANYFRIAKELLKVEKNNEPKEEPPVFINKKEKALEIIAKKQVNIYSLMLSEDYTHYNKHIWCSMKRSLTQEEFDLIKEVIKSYE